MLEKDGPLPDNWSFYGTDFGGKVNGLLDFEKEGVTNVEVVPGNAIGASFFREFILENKFDENSWPNDVNRTGKLPDKLREANRQILSSLSPGTCLAVRSSVVGENEGVGVYSSYFMVVSGDIETDLETVGRLELGIYADYFSYDSRDLLADKFLDTNEGGVGLLVQKVVGDQYGEFFMPAISGVVTFINGELALRVVLGLGTKAVEMRDAIVLKRDNLRQEIIERALLSLREIEVISLTANKLVLGSPEYDWSVVAIAQVGKLMKLVKAWQSLEVRGKPYYCEFAVTDAHDHPQILQVNREEPYDEKTSELGPVTGRVMCESNDVVNTGTKVGRGIVHLDLSGSAPENLQHLFQFNMTNKDYLLIVNDVLFDEATYKTRLNISHFGNAAGVVERQLVRQRKPFHLWGGLDHVGRGGTHFVEVCKRRDILFQGCVVRLWDKSLEEALGPFSERFGPFGGYWDLEYKMTNTNNEGRVEIYGETVKREYSREKLLLWIDELRSAAEILESEDETTSPVFYFLTGYLFAAAGQSVADYDPYGFVDQLLLETLQGLEAGFDAIFKRLDLTDSYVAYRQGLGYGITEADGNVFELKEYLQKLKLKIEAKRATITLG